MLTNLQARLKKASRMLPLALLPFAAHAQAPANDNPSGAVALTLSAACTPLSTTNTGATTTAVTGLGYTNPGCGIATSPKDVWYTFTTNATGAGSTAAVIQVTGTVAGQVRAFSTTNGATGPFTQIGCAAGTTNNTQAAPLTLFNLTPSTTYYVFVSGYGSGDTQGAFTICATTVTNNDATVTNIQTLGTVSTTYGSPVTVRATVRNVGGNTQTALPVTLTVAGATTFTNTQTVASLAPGASTTVTFTTYPVTTAGVNTLTVSVPADDIVANNSLPYSQTVTAGSQGYVDTTQPFSASTIGVGAANGVLAVKYSTSAPAAVTSITPTFVGAGTAATTYQLQVFSATATGPGTLLYTSATLTRPTTTGPVPTAIPGISVTGDFYVGIKELDNNVALANQVENPLRAGTFYYTVTGGTTWVDVSTTTLRTRIALDITLSAPSACGVATAITTTGITTTAASVGFTAPSGATSYTVTYTPTGGTATTVTPAPTASPIALTGLTPGTNYTVSVITNCAAGQASSAVTTTFSTLAAAPANDACANAIALPVGTTCTNTVGTTAGATASTAPTPAPACGGIAVGPLADVWYTVTVPVGGNLTVTTSAVTGSLLDDTVIEIYSGTCGALTSVGCNDDNPAGSDGFSVLSLTGQTAGATLYVRVRSYGNSATGQFNICASNPVVCGDPTAASIGNATSTSLQIAFTPGAGNTSYNVTYTSGSTVTTVTPAPTTSPITITGLAPGTLYNITLQGVCANGGLGAVLTGSASTTGTPPAATYASLPYTESFEGPWVNGLSTRDLPTVNWRNSPATGDQSWRRDDDGTIANWRYLPSGAYTPAFSAGAHSARFHTYGAGPSGVLGTLDLYVNMSGAGNKLLTFDYINPTGTDSLKVFVSTDGGATFAATPARQLAISTTFAPVQPVTIASTSATTVIRFRAKSDFGNDDIGIDNLRIAVVTGTRNETLAATVGLYPNPTHQRFTLSVPAGSLHTASASLINALGQVVQARQLSLPAAGGTADFDVSGLAAGVYSLQLKSGNDLVVKRVVVE